MRTPCAADASLDAGQKALAAARVAIRGKDADGLREAWERGCSLDGLDGDALASTAAKADWAAGLEWMLRMGLDPNQGDRQGANGLMWAAVLNRHECMALLLAAGADPNAGMEGNSLTALTLASRAGNARCAAMLSLAGVRGALRAELGGKLSRLSGPGAAQEWEGHREQAAVELERARLALASREAAPAAKRTRL